MSLYMTTDRPAPLSRSRAGGSQGFGGKQQQLNKVLPKNPKYAAVKATLNTGSHAGNVKPKIDRSGEPFRRISRKQLVNLMRACEMGDESVYSLQESWESGGLDPEDDASSVRSGLSSSSRRSSASSAASQPLVATHSAPSAGASGAHSDHFLLLDLRDDEVAFQRAHIAGALAYSMPMLRRDHFPPNLYQMKNAPSKLVVLYDSDETSKLALEAAVLFVQKGWNNVMLLTGGFKAFAEKYADRLQGERAHVLQAKMSEANRTMQQSMAGTPSSRIHTAGSQRLHSATGSFGAAPSSRPMSGVGSVRGGPPQPQSFSATSLNFVPARDERDSPREVMARMQHQQQQSQFHHPLTHSSASSSSSAYPAASSSRSNAPSTAASSRSRAAPPSQISSRPFR